MSTPRSTPQAPLHPPVTLYTLPGCLVCRRARAFLGEHRVPFREVNVLTHPRQVLKLLIRFHTVLPIVMVGNQALSGFHRKQLAEALGLKLTSP